MGTAGSRDSGLDDSRIRVAGFNYEHMAQLNTYVSWYKRNIMIAGDNPPVGILLCTRKDHALVEYALISVTPMMDRVNLSDSGSHYQ
jgi:hypothetical protein